MSELDGYYEAVLELVKQGGNLIRENISRQKTVLIKSCDVDLVTETDQMVEKLLINGISAKFPNHKFIGEENTAESNHRVELTDAPTWIIDPVDGTMNFVHAMPHTCISIALYINKRPEIGIVYNPVLEQFFSARRGEGAFYNGAQIRVSGEKDLNKALVMMELGTSRDSQKMKIVMENLKTLTPLVHGTRALGSCALNMCMVAMGAADLMHEFSIHIWDIAAGDLIVREAGGVCIDPAGGDLDPLSRRVLCASSPELAQQVTKILVQYYPDRD
ncbi:PREDICTED: inositol monophosphatase 1-like [Ceratosolen solmsi marchali]|uniref:Inositol-1-monophosphatase n=1 Tax=Ceratosolen solmsi marchali TaxID=326594 RepID=A0AAJ6VNB9_9HYME|nr:PREDICTED: inositol monophosphatase 1-like [Ceratosolen solmsi marchali]